MDRINRAVIQLVESKTEVEEQKAAEQVAEIIRDQQLSLNLIVHDTVTGNIIPLVSLKDTSKQSIYVLLNVNFTHPPIQQRWIPKKINNIYILLRE